jgi:hypothetical protein
MVLGLVALPVLAQAQVVVGPGGGTTMRFSTGSRSGLAGADVLERAPEANGVTAWTVGQWARYSSTRVLNAQYGISAQSFRLVSVLAKNGGKYWVEVQDDVMSPQRQALPIRRMLVPFGPLNRNAASETLVLDPQDSSIVKMTTLRAGTQADTVPAFPQGWTKVGPEDVTAAGATFHTTHWKKGAEEVWVAANAGPIGVVKFRSDDTTVELVARGETGAKSKIPESGQ